MRFERRVEDQSGFVLIEAMFTLALMGLSLVGVLAAMAVAVRSTQLHTEVVQSGLSTTQVAEQIGQAAYVPCNAFGGTIPANSYNSAITAKPGYTITIEQITYLQDRAAVSPTFGTACPTSPKLDQGAQRMVVVVTANAGKVRGKLTVIKRDNKCPTGIPTYTDQRC